jgi:hypothetical protein
VSPNHLTYLERLRLTWSFTWPLLLVDVAWAVALFAAGESDNTNLEIGSELFAFFVVSPLVVRWVVSQPQRGYRFQLTHAADPHKPTYQESFKMMWLLNWRLLALMLASLGPLSLLLRQLPQLTVVLKPVIASPFFNKIGLTAVDLLASLALMPFLIPGMIRKRYQGFRVQIQRP